MNNKYTITTVAVVYNSKGELMVTKRAGQEDHAAGVYSYPGGKLEYDGSIEGTDALDLLESNLRKELHEETAIEVGEMSYLSSHGFKKESGDLVVVVAYLAEYVSGEPVAADPTEVSEVSWITPDSITETIDYEIVQTVYRQAADALKAQNNLHHITLAGMVLNEDSEFLLVKYKDSPDELQVPKAPLTANAPSGWEAMEHELAKSLHSQLGVSVKDGQIPFTDQILMDRSKLSTVMQYFICRYDAGDLNPADAVTEARWVHINDIERGEVNEKDYLMLYKAHEFISSLS